MSHDRSYESSSGHSGADAENSGHLSDHSLGYDEVGVSLIYSILFIVSTDREKHTSSAERTESQKRVPMRAQGRLRAVCGCQCALRVFSCLSYSWSAARFGSCSRD